MKLIFSLIFGLLTINAQAQELHSKANLVQDYDTFVSGMKIGVHLDIEQGWHAYWENPGDVGAPPEMQILSSVPITQSDMHYPLPHRIEANPYDSFGYEHEALFYKTITLADNSVASEAVTLDIQVDWLICKEICVPCTKTFKLELPAKGKTKQNNEHFNFFPFPKSNNEIQTSLESTPDQTILTIQSPLLKKDTHPDFFPVAAMTGIFNKAEKKEFEDGKAVFHYAHTKSKLPDVVGVLKINEKEGYWIGRAEETVAKTETPETSAETLSLLYIFLFAFLGGLLLNLMPCVLPVVSLKLLSVMKATHEKKNEIRASNLWFAAGILVSLMTFAFIFLQIQSSGEKLGWGFQLQSPTFVSFLIILFFAIGLNLIGFFEVNNIPIPGLGRLLQSDSWTSDFLAGFFTTVVATPCTAPFMAVAIGFALTQNNWTIFATFAALGLGLSFPYLLLSAFPNLIHLVPKPGAWMVTLKEFLSFPMFLTVAWLTWVLSQLTDDRAVLSTLSALTLVVLFFWARRNIFNKQGLQKKIVLLLILAAIFMALRVPFMKKMDESLSWESFDQQKIESYAKSEMVFVDFTADWCLTCKTNERITFSNPEVIDTIHKNKIKMIKADWTRRNPEITKVLQQYDRAGVPFYLLYKPTLTKPLVLPTLLTPSIFIDAAIGKGE